MPEVRIAAPHANLSVADGVALLLGVVVGVGIFKTPSLVAANVDSAATFLGVWLLGGLVTLIGALCYAELGSARPHPGGEYHYLCSAYGRPLGLLFAWARGTVIQTGAIALVAFVYGDYASVLVPLGPHGASIHAATAVLALTLLNLVGTRHTKGAQILLSGLTAVALVTVAAVGLTAGVEARPPTAGTAHTSGALGLAMVFVLLTFGGWNEVAYLTAELRDVQRRMARMLLVALSAVVLIYVAVNLSYLRVFGLDGLRETNAIGADLMKAVAGDMGAVLLSLVVCCGALSTMNATIFTGARVYYALGRDLAAAGALGVWDERGHKPGNALLLQGAIALLLIGFGTFARDGFEAMVEFTAPVFWFFMLLVALSLFVFRQREPDRPLPFRVPLYPFTPILFAMACAGMLYSAVNYTGVGGLAGVAVLLAGTPLLLLRGARSAPETAE